MQSADEIQENLEINGNTLNYVPDVSLNVHLVCLLFLPFFFLLKIEIFSLIKSHYFSHQNLRSHESHIKYLENFLDILHLPLEFFLSPLCALGGRTQMNSIIRVDLACGFLIKTS